MALGLGSGIGTGDQTQHTIDGNDGGRTIADKGQGQTDNGHDAQAHAHIDHHLENQRRSGAEAYQTTGIVGGFDGHIDAAGNDGQLQQQDQHTTEETQFLTDGGENVVRMLGEEVAALGTGAVEQALAGQAAAGKGQQIDFVVITFVDAQRVNGGIEQNKDSISLIVTQELPQNGEGNRDAADGQAEPDQADTTGKSHADEDEHENQGNASVSGQDHVQTDQDAQMGHHVDNGSGVGNSVLV